MKIKEIISLPTNELSLVLEGVVSDYYALKTSIKSAVDPDRKKMSTISKKIVNITIELRHRGWEAVEYEGKVNYTPLSNTKEQRKLL